MRMLQVLLRSALLALLWLIAGASALAQASTPPGWTLVWSDEFDGTQLDRSKWDIELGNGFFQYEQNTWIAGWGNKELQYYTREPENVFVRDGFLHLRALREARDGAGYTSGRVSTRKRDGGELYSKTYGRFEIRASLPLGQGLWPALWMLPRDHAYGGWAASGEIDLVEARGQEPDRVHGTLHYGSPWPANVSSGGTHVFGAGESIADFHVYALEWEPGVMRWFVDGKLAGTQTGWWSSGRMAQGQGAAPRSEADIKPWPAPFDQPFYLVMNLAVGGNYLGNPDRTTRFPAEMRVDYVRVYDRVAGYGPAPPRRAGSLPAFAP